MSKPPSSIPSGAPALWQQLGATARLCRPCALGTPAAQPWPPCPASLRPGVQALLLESCASWGGAGAAPQLARAPAPALDALLCTALALAWDEASAPYAPFTLVNQAVEAAEAWAPWHARRASSTPVCAAFCVSVRRCWPPESRPTPWPAATSRPGGCGGYVKTGPRSGGPSSRPTSSTPHGAARESAKNHASPVPASASSYGFRSTSMGDCGLLLRQPAARCSAYRRWSRRLGIGARPGGPARRALAAAGPGVRPAGRALRVLRCLRCPGSKPPTCWNAPARSSPSPSTALDVDATRCARITRHLAAPALARPGAVARCRPPTRLVCHALRRPAL